MRVTLNKYEVALLLSAIVRHMGYCKDCDKNLAVLHRRLSKLLVKEGSNV